MGNFVRLLLAIALTLPFSARSATFFLPVDPDSAGRRPAHSKGPISVPKNEAATPNIDFPYTALRGSAVLRRAVVSILRSAADRPDQDAKTDVCAILSFVFGALTLTNPYTALPFGIAAIALGLAALRRIETSGRKGRGLAIAGIAMGFLFLLFWLIMVVLMVLLIGFYLFHIFYFF